MTIPEENLTAMVEFLTDISETSGDHFMQAAAMLRALEWSRPVIDSNGFLGQGCIECGRGRESGHTEKCVAAAILRDTEQAGMGGE